MAEAAIKHQPGVNYRELAEKWMGKYHRMVSSNKEALEGLARRGMTEAVGVGVGLLSGVARGLWGNPTTGEVEIEGVDVHIASTVLVNGLALAGAFGGASDGMAVAGAVLAGITTDRQAEKYVRQAVAK